MEMTVRHSEPEDYKAMHRIFSGQRAIAGTLQMPLPRPRRGASVYRNHRRGCILWWPA